MKRTYYDLELWTIGKLRDVLMDLVLINGQLLDSYIFPNDKRHYVLRIAIPEGKEVEFERRNGVNLIVREPLNLPNGVSGL